MCSRNEQAGAVSFVDAEYEVLTAAVDILIVEPCHLGRVQVSTRRAWLHGVVGSITSDSA